MSADLCVVSGEGNKGKRRGARPSSSCNLNKMLTVELHAAGPAAGLDPPARPAPSDQLRSCAGAQT